MSSEKTQARSGPNNAIAILDGLMRSVQESSSMTVQQEADKLQNGIASLVLNLVETIIEVLERQAFRRFNAGSLTDQEIERLGIAFAQMRERMADLAYKFNYQPKALELALKTDQSENEIVKALGANLDGETRSVSLADVIDELIDKKAVIAGDVRISVAGVDLVTLNLLASISNIGGNAVHSSPHSLAVGDDKTQIGE